MSAHLDSTGSSAETRLNAVFDALSHPLRRRVLATMHDSPQSNGEFELEDFLRPEDSRERPALELYHNHLPHLDAAGFVDWNDEANTVARGPRYEEVRPVLAALRDEGTELPGNWP